MQDLGLGELPVQVGSQPDASQGPGLGEEGRFVKHGGWQERMQSPYATLNMRVSRW